MRKSKKQIYKFLSLLTFFSLILGLFSFPTQSSADPVKIYPVTSPEIDFSKGYTLIFDSNTSLPSSGQYSVPENLKKAGVDSFKYTDQKEGSDFKLHIQNLAINSNFKADDKIYLVFDDNSYVQLNIGHTQNIEDKGHFKIYAGNGVASTPSDVSLDFSVTPTQPGGYLINKESGYAETAINSTIIPKGILGNEERRTPIDIIFIFDTSGSMVLDMECYNNKRSESKCKDTDKLLAAKNGAYKAIDEFKAKAVAGDRFALVPFAGQVKTGKPFNTITDVTAIQAHLDSIKTAISSLGADGGTNYFAALTKANQLFGSSNNPKYIVFLTDGRPDTDARSGNNENYPTVKVSGEFQKWGLVTKEVQDKEWQWNSKKWRWEWKYTTKTITTNGWTTTKYPVNTQVSLRIDNKNVIFNHNNEKYLYLTNYNDLDYAYAMAAASNLASKGIKLLSIGFGTSGDVDLDFLNSLSNLTGTTAQLGSKANISTIFEDVSNKVNKLALRNIKVRIKIKEDYFLGSVGLGENAVLDANDPNYAIINFEDISFEQGLKPTSKLFSFTFEKPGSYTFTDVQLQYIDLSNNQRFIPGAAFTVIILESKSNLIKFISDRYDIDVHNGDTELDLTEEVIPVEEDGELPESLTWSSTNTQVATVVDGIVYPKGVGTTDITVTSVDDPTITDSATVYVNLESISFKYKNYEYIAGKNMFAELDFSPKGFNVPPEVIEWSTNNSALSVNNKGELSRTGSMGGYVLVTAKLKDAYIFDPSDIIKSTTLVKVNPQQDNTNVDKPNKEW